MKIKKKKIGGREGWSGGGRGWVGGSGWGGGQGGCE